MKTKRKINDSLTYFSNNMTDQCINRSKIQPQQQQHSVLYTKRSPLNSQKSDQCLGTHQTSVGQRNSQKNYFFKTENASINLKLFQLKTPKNKQICPQIRQIEQFKCHNHTINSLQTQKINHQVVIFTASHDYSIKAHLFDTQDHSLETIHSVRKAHSRYVTSLAKVEDTSLLVSGGADKALKFWEFNPEDFYFQYKFGKQNYHGGQINKIKTLNNHLYTSSQDQTVKVLDLPSTQCVRTLQQALDFSILNKNQFMVSDHKNLKLFDLRLGKYQSKGCLKFEDKVEISHFTSLEDENMFLVANRNFEVQLVDVRKMLQIQKIGMQGGITALHAFSAGRASIAYEGALRVFNTRDFTEYGEYTLQNKVVDIAEYEDYLFLGSNNCALDILKIDYL